LDEQRRQLESELGIVIGSRATSRPTGIQAVATGAITTRAKRGRPPGRPRTRPQSRRTGGGRPKSPVTPSSVTEEMETDVHEGNVSTTPRREKNNERRMDNVNGNGNQNTNEMHMEAEFEEALEALFTDTLTDG